MDTKYTAEQIDETLVTLRKEGAFKRCDLLKQLFSFAEAYAAALREREKDAYCQEGVTCPNCEREATTGGVTDEMAGRFHDDLMRREGSARRWGSMGEWQRGAWRDALQAIWPAHAQQAHSDAKERGDFSMDVRHLIVCDAHFDWAGETILKLPEIERLIARGWLAEGHENAEYEITDAGRTIIDNVLSQSQQGEPVAWVVDWPNEPELGHYFAEVPSATGRSRPLYANAERQVVPAGWKLVPEKFGIPADAWEGAAFAFGGPGTGDNEPYLDCTAWIGTLDGDGDTPAIHGLHVSCDECQEEGSITLAEFPAAPQPEGGES